MESPAPQSAPGENLFYFGCVYASLIVFVARPGEVFPFLAGTKLAFITLAITFLAFLTSNGSQAVQQGDYPGTSKIKIFLFIGFIDIIFSKWPRMAFEAWSTILLINTALYFFWLPAVLNPARLRKFVTILALAAGCLVLAMLVFESAVRGKGAEVGRLSVGSTYDPNDIAMVLSLVFPLTVFLFSRSRLKGKLLWGALLIGLVLGILSTGSRGGVLALAVACLLLLFTVGKALKTWHKVLVVALVVGFFISPAATTVKERWQTVFSGDDYNLENPEEGGVGRLSLWISGAQLIAKNPLTGVGVSNTSNAMGVEYHRWRAMHSAYFQVGLELGLPGLVVFLLLLRTIWRNCSQALRLFGRDPGQPSLALLAGCTRIALVAYMVAVLFLSQAYSLMVIILLLISDGLYHISGEKKKQDGG